MNDSYIPYYFKGRTLLINSFLLLSKTPCSGDEYDIFNVDRPDDANKINELLNQESITLQIFNNLDFGFYNKISAIPDSINNKILLFTEINCIKDHHIVINFCCSKNAKLWVNGKICANQSKPWNETNYISAFLKIGKNYIVIEQYVTSGKELFSLQILDYDYEMSKVNPLTSIVASEDFTNLKDLVLISGSDYLPDEKTYRFMYIANSPELYNQKYEIEVEDSSIGLFRKFTADLNKPVDIDIEELRKAHSDTLRFERIRCVFELKDGSKKIADRSIILNDFSADAKEIIDFNHKLSYELSEFNANQLLGREQNLKVEYDTGSAFFWKVWILKYIHGVIKKGEYYSKYYLGFGTHEVYIKSKLDNSLIRINLHLPEGFDINKEYPLMITIATSLYSESSDSFPENKLTEKVIHADITGRGFTCGSYIAEASILEVLEWIKSNYRINENRIYGIGFSSGGYAVWSLAQNHPHLFAAIYPIGSYPNTEIINNLSNIDVFNIVSDWDNIQVGKPSLKSYLSRYLKYHQFDIKQYIHNHLWRFRLSPYILNKMLECERNPFPRELDFKTYRNRHLVCYWIELLGISKFRKYSHVKANIYDRDLIRISVKNADGLRIKIPPYINTKDFVVEINKSKFRFTNYSDNEITFVNQHGFRVARDNKCKFDITKGTGLLDVYLDKLKIIIPENTNESISKLAKKFSKPHTNGFVSDIYVNYPICTDKSLPKSVWDNNLIVIDFNKTNTFVKGIKGLLPIQVNETGYTYKDTAFNGKCCVMQIIQNPYYPEYSILAIETNDISIIKKNVLLRKIIIPTYTNGIHPYWNNKMLILTDDGIFGVYEDSSELTKL